MKKRSAMSLLELLVVIGIVMLLLGLIVPSVSGVQAAYRLSMTGQLMEDQMKLARKLAIARNRPVIFSLCKSEDEKFDLVLLHQVQPDESLEMLTRPLRLPEGFSVAEGAPWSSLLTLPAENVSFKSKSLECRQIEFRPSGATDLAPSNSWFLTLFDSEKSATPKDNFITLVLDPLTGTTTSHQP